MKISNSTPFYHKARCYKCGSIAKIVYYTLDSADVQDPAVQIAVNNFFLEIAPKPYYLVQHMKTNQITSASIYNQKITHCKYSTSFHKNEKAPTTQIIQVYICDCGKKGWKILEPKHAASEHKRAKATYPAKIFEW